MCLTTTINKLLKIKFIIPVALTVLLSSCNTEEGKEAVGFLVGFFVFIVGTIVAGVPAIVLSAVSISTTKKAIPILAIVFTVVYLIFLAMQTSVFMDSDATGSTTSVFIFPIITLMLIGMCVVFIVMGFNNRSKGITKNSSSENALDEILLDDSDDIEKI